MLAQKVVTIKWDEGTDLIISNRGVQQHDSGYAPYCLLDLDTAILVAKAVLAVCEPTAIAGDVMVEVERIVARHTDEGRRIAEQEAEDARHEALEYDADFVMDSRRDMELEWA
jgi:hypothetical protein